MADDMTLEEMRVLAIAAGLNLPDEEVARLLPGVARSKKQTADLRRLIRVDNEPAATFAALKPFGK